MCPGLAFTIGTLLDCVRNLTCARVCGWKSRILEIRVVDIDSIRGRVEREHAAYTKPGLVKVIIQQIME